MIEKENNWQKLNGKEQRAVIAGKGLMAQGGMKGKRKEGGLKIPMWCCWGKPGPRAHVSCNVNPDSLPLWWCVLRECCTPRSCGYKTYWKRHQREEECRQRVFKVGTKGTSEQTPLAFSAVPDYLRWSILEGVVNSLLTGTWIGILFFFFNF